MFEILSGKLAKVFRLLSGKGRLGEKDIDDALRQMRLVLLEADVNFKVVKDFTARVGERSLGAQVLQSLTPAQQMIKIVNEGLIAIVTNPGDKALIALLAKSVPIQPPTALATG